MMSPLSEAGTVYVIDDDLSVRSSLVSFVESQGYSTRGFATAKAFLAATRNDSPACIVLDLRLPQCSGLDVQERLHAAGDQTPIVFISGCGDVPSTAAAMKAGAVDFLTKPFDPDRLVGAIHEGIARDLRRTSHLAAMAELELRFARLTPRQLQVLALLLQGCSNKKIAAALGTVVQTIKVHRAAVMKRLEVGSMAELVHLVDTITDEPWASAGLKPSGESRHV